MIKLLLLETDNVPIMIVAWESHVNQNTHTECCTVTMHMSHTLIQISSHLTQFHKENDQNFTWKTLHVSHNILYSQICHKHIPIMVWKDQKRKEIATCGKFVSPE